MRCKVLGVLELDRLLVLFGCTGLAVDKVSSFSTPSPTSVRSLDVAMLTGVEVVARGSYSLCFREGFETLNTSWNA